MNIKIAKRSIFLEISYVGSSKFLLKLRKKVQIILCIICIQRDDPLLPSDYLKLIQPFLSQEVITLQSCRLYKKTIYKYIKNYTNLYTTVKYIRSQSETSQTKPDILSISRRLQAPRRHLFDTHIWWVTIWVKKFWVLFVLFIIKVCVFFLVKSE